MLRFLIPSMALVALTGCASARHVYVATNGTPEAEGTLEQPFQSIQKAVDQLQAGDTCYIRGGVYRETIEFRHSGQPGKPIRVQAYDNEPVKVWAVQWPQLLLQNQWSQIINNAGLNMSTVKHKEIVFKERIIYQDY